MQIPSFIVKFILTFKGVKCNNLSRVFTLNIGKGTRIWAFTTILKESSIGEDCNICDGCFIESGVTIGDRVTLKTNVSLWTGVTVENDVFIGPGVQFCNDKYPRSKKYDRPIELTNLGAGSSIGSGAIILSGITIGDNAMIGAGSVVTESIPPNTYAFGNPARVIRSIKE